MVENAVEANDYIGKKRESNKSVDELLVLAKIENSECKNSYEIKDSSDAPIKSLNTIVQCIDCFDNVVDSFTIKCQRCENIHCYKCLKTV